MKLLTFYLKQNSALLIYLSLLFCPTLISAQDNATNTGIMYISAGTLVSAEGAFTTSATANTENAGDFRLKGDWTNDGTYTTSTGAVTFWGNNVQTINGTNSTTFYDLNVDKSSNGVTLNKNTDVSNILSLTNGPLDLNSKTLTITNSATTAIGYTSGYIISEDVDNSSKVQWNMGAITGAHVIPFGTVAGDPIPVTLDLTAGTIGNVTASTFSTAANNTPYPISPEPVIHVRDNAGVDNSANMVDRFWQINKTGASGTLTTTFTYTDAEVPANGEIGLIAQRYGTGFNGWDAGVPFQTNNMLLNTVTTPGITTFGPYALALSANPLPVELLVFNAVPNAKKEVEINWVTASEKNSDFFTVERSKDAINFETIEKVKAAGSSSNMLHYNTLDKKPYDGISYYRLKQTDFNGVFTYSKTKKVSIDDGINTTISVFPTPASNEVWFTLKNFESTTPNLKADLFDSKGNLIASKKYDNYSNSSSNNTYKIERNHIESGVYYLNITDQNGMSYKSKIIFE